jgi:hypothetical protein
MIGVIHQPHLIDLPSNRLLSTGLSVPIESPGLRIWCSHLSGGEYQVAAGVSLGDPATQDVDPAAAPDQSFIVFGSMHPGRRSRHRQAQWSAELSVSTRGLLDRSRTDSSCHWFA